MIRELAAMVSPASDLRYLPNELHGDEIVAADGTVYVEEKHEWLDSDEVAALLDARSNVSIALVDWADHAVPTMYRFTGSRAGLWKTVLSKRYLTDDGYPPAEASYALVAYRWVSATGESLLLFQLDC